MPIYDFKCTKCEHVVEKMQKYSDPPPACPECGEETQRTVSPSNLRFVGGGWATKNHHKDTGDFA